MSNQFDCAGTSYPVCPHCGHEHKDVGEWVDADGEGQCESCEMFFQCNVEMTPHFYTSCVKESEAGK